MKIIMVGVFYFKSQVRYLYTIFKIYKALAKVFSATGIEVKYFTKQNEILPLQDTLTEAEFNKQLPECDLLFMWNGGLSPEKILAEKCIKMGIPIYFMELGWFPQRGTFYFDRKGVNYGSSMVDWKHKGITSEQLDWLRPKIQGYHKKIDKTSIVAPKDFVFVPFQVENDSQIINYSPRFKKMQQLVDYVCRFVPGKIIFKTHPKGDVSDIKVPDRCELCKVGAIGDFLPHCKYVVTINSTVGVEALTFNKPVINLGGAFYEARGLTYRVTNDAEFKDGVEWANKGKVAIGVISAFLHYLFKRQWHSGDLNNPEKILGLIEDLTEKD